LIALVALLLIVCIALPLSFAWRLWRLDEPTLLGWSIVVAEASLFVTLIMLLGRWDVAGMWTRTALIALLVIAAIVSLFRHVHRPWREVDGPPIWRHRGVTLASLVVYGSALVYVLTGIVSRHDPRPFAFPLEGGWFVVAQGGGVSLLNYHSTHRAQRYALDITGVNSVGFRASTLLPADPARYAIFGKTVISPCTGSVVSAVDGLPDQSPPTSDRKNPAGNNVVLTCNDVQIELAHLRKGSVAVKTGDQVLTGQRLGQVGNSGNSTEPHLHVHAVDPKSGAGVQISFDGVVPVRGTDFRR